MNRPEFNLVLKLFTILPLFAVFSATYASDPIVSNLSVVQRHGTRLVDITYDLAASSSVTVSVEIATNWYTRWTIAASSLNGNGFGSSVAPGIGKKMVWDAGADWPGRFSTDAWFKVTADNGWCPAGFAMIPSGMFVMGDPFGDDNGFTDEMYLHSVNISAFYMGQTEVSKSEWDSVYDWATSNGYTFANGGAGKATNHPVYNVNWFDCVKWCNARSEKEGLCPCYYTTAAQTDVYRTGQIDLAIGCVNWATNGYRLPTDAEWEKAARGGAAGRRFSWSDVDTISHTQANYSSDCSGYDIGPTPGPHPLYHYGASPFTSPIGSFSANGYGLYDMIGNLNEWGWDSNTSGSWWYLDPRASQADTRGPPDEKYRICRGGNWTVAGFYCRVAAHSHWVSPYETDYSCVGFRCARSRPIPVCGGVTIDTGGPRPYGDVELIGTNAIGHDSARRVVLQVSRMNGTYGAASVRYATANVTATSGVDYASTSGRLSWANGEGDTKTITVPVIYRRGIQGPRSFTLTLSNATGAALGSPTQTVVTIQDAQPVFNDYDGDGCSDLAVYDDANGLWYVIGAQGAVIAWAFHWGFPGATLVPGDYDGDGCSDLAVYDEQTGLWYILSVQGAPIAWAAPWGGPGLDPVRGDYDGDGISDLAVYDVNAGLWYIITAQGEQLAWALFWGGVGYDPVWGDYDGDMRDDSTVYDTGTGMWYSRTVLGQTIAWAIPWGVSHPVTKVPGDYDGDMVSDFAIYSITEEFGPEWNIVRINMSNIYYKKWGGPGLMAVPGDYDGDMVSDMAIFDEATALWSIWSISRGLILDGFAWGWPGCRVVGACGQ